MFLMTISTKDLPIIRVIYFIKTLLSFVSIIIPIILIVVATIELFKVLTKPDESKKSVSKIINKFIYAIVIFFIPILVNFLMNMVGTNTLDKIEYWTSADNKTIKQLTKLKEKESALNKRIKAQKQLEEYKQKSIASIEDLEALKENRKDKLSEEEIKKIDEIINANKEAIKNKLSDENKNKALKEISELKSYNIEGTIYPLEQLEYIIENGNEGQNIDLVYKYLDDINDALIELEPSNSEAESLHNKLSKTLDIASADIKNVKKSLNKVNKEKIKLEEQIRKENKKNNSSNSNNVYASSSSQRDQIVSFALKHVGVTPYVYGGTSLKTGADCSGFIQAVYANFGISIPRTTNTQANGGRKISFSQLKPGDLIFSRNYGHVTMYIGNNQVVQAQCTRCGPVKITNIPSNAHDAVSYLD